MNPVGFLQPVPAQFQDFCCNTVAKGITDTLSVLIKRIEGAALAVLTVADALCHQVGIALNHIQSNICSFIDNIVRPHNPSPFEAAFKTDLLRRIPRHEREAAIAEVQKLNPPTQEELEALKSGQWSHPLFTQASLPYLALRAYLEGHLDANRAAKLFLYSQCVRESPAEHPVRTYQLIQNGEKQNDAVELLKKGLSYHYSDTELEELMKTVAALPEDVGQFFAAESPLFETTSEILLERIRKRQPFDIMAEIYHLSERPFLLVREGPKRGVQLVIPPALLHIIYQSKYGATAMQPNPVLGFFTKERLSDPDKRVLAIATPFSTLPQKVHTCTATGLSHYHHDAGYHLLIESANVHRRAWIELAEVAEISPEVRVLLLDRELVVYLKRNIYSGIYERELRTDKELFWYALALFFTRVKMQCGKEIHDKNLPLCINHLVKNASRWEREYGIDLASLQEAYATEKPGVTLSVKGLYELSRPQR